jgi:hypothetical protein
MLLSLRLVWMLGINGSAVAPFFREQRSREKTK